MYHRGRPERPEPLDLQLHLGAPMFGHEEDLDNPLEVHNVDPEAGTPPAPVRCPSPELKSEWGTRGFRGRHATRSMNSPNASGEWNPAERSRSNKGGSQPGSHMGSAR